MKSQTCDHQFQFLHFVTSIPQPHQPMILSMQLTQIRVVDKWLDLAHSGRYNVSESRARNNLTPTIRNKKMDTIRGYLLKGSYYIIGYISSQECFGVKKSIRMIHIPLFFVYLGLILKNSEVSWRYDCSIENQPSHWKSTYLEF